MSQTEFVLDSYAVLALLQKEPGYGRVETLLKGAVSGENKVHMSAINLAEVQYHVLRKAKDASRILAALEALPIRVASADTYMAQAVNLRAQYGVPLGNCFAAALAQDLKLPLVTGDRQLRKFGSSIEVEWLR